MFVISLDNGIRKLGARVLFAKNEVRHGVPILGTACIGDHDGIHAVFLHPRHFDRPIDAENGDNPIEFVRNLFQKHPLGCVQVPVARLLDAVHLFCAGGAGDVDDGDIALLRSPCDDSVVGDFPVIQLDVGRIDPCGVRPACPGIHRGTPFVRIFCAGIPAMVDIPVGMDALFVILQKLLIRFDPQFIQPINKVGGVFPVGRS